MQLVTVIAAVFSLTCTAVADPHRRFGYRIQQLPSPSAGFECSDKSINQRLMNLDDSYLDSFNMPLHIAAENNDLQLMRCLLDKGAYINSIGKYSKTPLHTAATAGKVQAVRFLLENGASVDSVDDIVGDTPVHCCAAAGHVAILRLLLSNGADPTALNRKRNTPMHRAAAAGQVDAMRILFQYGASVEALGYLGKQPLHDAALSGSVDAVKMLLEYDVDPNVKDLYTKSTPLIGAATFDYINVCSVLINHGANVNANDEVGDTALHKAASFGKPRMAAFLLSKGANTEVKGRFDRTPLLYAAVAGHVGTGRRLLNRGANIEALDQEGSSALHLAAQYGRGNFIRLLLDKANGGQSTRLVNKFGKTPGEVARDNGHLSIARYLMLYPFGNPKDLDESADDGVAALVARNPVSRTRIVF